MNLRNHLRVVGWAGASKIPPLLYGVVFLFVLIPALPVEEHGRYAIVFTLFTLTTLLNKLLILTPMIHFAAAPDCHARMVRAGVQLSLLFYALAGAAIGLTAPVVAQMLRLSASDIRLIPTLLAAIFFREAGFCVQQTCYRMNRIFVLEAVYYLGSAAGFILLAYQGRMTTAGTALAVNFTAAGLSSLLALGYGFDGARVWLSARREDARAILRYGVPTLGAGFSSFLNYGLDIQLLAAVYSPTQVAVYNGAKKVYQIISSLSQAASLVVMPYASKLTAENRRDELRVTYEKVTGYNTALMVLIAAGGWLAAGWMYRLMLGPAYAGSAPLLRLLLLAAPFEGLFIVGGNLLYGFGAVKRLAWISFAIIAVWFGLAVTGIYGFHGGGPAAALAVIGSMMFAGIAVHLHAAKNFDTSAASIGNRLLRNIDSVLRPAQSRRPTSGDD